MKPETTADRWDLLQARAHLPQVQAIIRREISRGTIRVVPAPGGVIRIIRMSGTSTLEEPDPSLDCGFEKDQTKAPVFRVERITQ